MKTTIDAAGRLVVPKAVRESAGLKPGRPLIVRHRDGIVEITPAPLAVRIEEDNYFTVARPLKKGPPLESATVRQTIRTIRKRGPL